MTTKYEAVVFDWAGTTVDFGSFAPMVCFCRTVLEIRRQCHHRGSPACRWACQNGITSQQCCLQPSTAEKWLQVHGGEGTEADIDWLYAEFIPMNERVAAQYATLVPGTAEAVANLRGRGMKIGSTTGYTRSIMNHVVPVAKQQGYDPDCLVCSDDLPYGRPSPMGIYKCCLDLGVADARSLIKVDDTEPGIAEGVAAGCLTVGVALSGNYVGKTPEELALASDQDLDNWRNVAATRLKDAGANYVIDTVADLPTLLDSQ